MSPGLICPRAPRTPPATHLTTAITLASAACGDLIPTQYILLLLLICHFPARRMQAP